MKYFSKLLGMLLIGAMLVTSCTDYAEDIKNLDTKVDNLKQELVEGQINPLKADLAATKTALEAAIAEANEKVAENKKAIEALEEVDKAHSAAIEAANKAIADAVENLEGQLAALETSHDADIEAVNNKIAAEVTKVNEAITAAVARIAENEKDIAALETKDAELAKGIADANAAIKANAELIKTNSESIKANAESIKTNSANIKANAESIKALQTSLAELAGQFAAYKTQLEATIATLQTRVATAEGAIDTLEENVAELYDLHDIQTTIINDVKNNLETFMQYVQDEFDALAAADEALETLIQNLDDKFEANKKVVEAQFEKAFGDIAANTAEINKVKTALETEVAERKAQDSVLNVTIAEHAEWLEELDGRLETAEGAIATLKTQADELYELHDIQALLIQNVTDNLETFMGYVEEQLGIVNEAIEAALEDAKTYADAKYEDAKEYADTQAANAEAAAIEAAKAYADNISVELTNKINALDEKLTKMIGDVDAKADGIAGDLKAYKESNDNALKALRGDMEALFAELAGRIQSVVFVPDHVDGAATIKWSQLGNALVESQSVLNFQVYPAACAAALTPEQLNFVFTDALKTTRGGEQPTLNVVKTATVAGKEGVVAVTVNARNLGQDFYSGEVAYAASLVVKNESANLASCYVNLAPATADKVDVELIPGAAPEWNGYPNHYTIEYVNTELTHVVLPEQEFAFTINGEGAYTIEEMLAAGYDIVVEKGEPTYEFNAPGMLKNVFNNVVDSSNEYYNYVSVNLSEATKEAVGGVETINYSYKVCGKELKASSKVRVIKIQRAVDMDDIEIVWNYEEDAASDAGDENTNSIDLATIVNSTLPEDVTYEEAIAAEDVTITVYENGVAVDDVEAEFIGTNDAPALSLQNFEWNKAYTIKAVYSLAAIDVTITINVNTVDRVRDAITIELADEQWSLTKEFETESETAAESIEAVYAKLVENGLNAKMGAADFLKDIFVTKAYATDANTANGADAAVTKLAIDATEGATIKSIYNITDFTAVPEAVEYVMTVTTWYGQVITFTKTLNIGLTPVEITLAPESEYLVKDLAFETEAEALTAIYENVTNVDKDSYTAADYLKAIFTNNTNFYAAEILANGEALANTMIVVAADGATATAIYNYEDFAATPKQVVYKSTYTTWYGQVVVINKVIDIDWTTYNYKHVTEFVYNQDGVYYSNPLVEYINTPKESQSLAAVSMTLNMSTAFNVVDKNDEIIYSLSTLGLKSTFDFVQQPINDYFKYSYTGTVPEILSKLEFDGNVLRYHGKDEKAYVKATLTLTNSNGVVTVLPTNFDKGQIYDGYYVVKYNPVSFLKKENLVVPLTPKVAKKYTYYIGNQLSLKDVRGYELITPGELVANDDNEITYAVQSWVEGNGTNGFANGVKASSMGVYGLQDIKFTLSDATPIPESLAKDDVMILTKQGELYFDNTNQIELTYPIKLEVKVEVRHIWGVEETTVPVTIYYSPVTE